MSWSLWLGIKYPFYSSLNRWFTILGASESPGILVKTQIAVPQLRRFWFSKSGASPNSCLIVASFPGTTDGLGTALWQPLTVILFFPLVLGLGRGTWSKSAGGDVRGSQPQASRKDSLSPEKKTQERLVLFFLWPLCQDMISRITIGILLSSWGWSQSRVEGRAKRIPGQQSWNPDSSSLARYYPASVIYYVMYCINGKNLKNLNTVWVRVFWLFTTPNILSDVAIVLVC